MGTTIQHHRPHFLNIKRIVTYFLYALIPLALLHYFLFSLSTCYSPPPHPNNTVPPSPPSSQGDRVVEVEHGGGGGGQRCDYSEGRWVFEPRGPLYNGTSCRTIKDGQNCMAHGRPDTGYLRWRWQPAQCDLPAFDPPSFLRLIRNKHVAFVGDSMARNQAESLLCLLATSDPPDLVYRGSSSSSGGGSNNGSSGGGGNYGDEDNKFRRWIFPAHNATVSIFWSPFLVKATEKEEARGVRHNRVFLDALDERWTSSLGRTDAVVLSVGHWFLLPGIYRENGEIVGCHYCPELNHTDTGFFDVFRTAIKNSLAEVRRVFESSSSSSSAAGRVAVATTFSPAHFEGEWDKAGACPKKDPYREGEKAMQYMDNEMRRIVLEEVAAAGDGDGDGDSAGVRFEALDVTKLAMMRPDGHPGPYMYANPFSHAGRGEGGDGEEEMRVQNDCVHWCLPGPVDTFNQILLQLLMRAR